MERVVKRVGPLRLKVPRAVWERLNYKIAGRLAEARKAAGVRVVALVTNHGAAQIVMETL